MSHQHAPKAYKLYLSQIFERLNEAQVILSGKNMLNDAERDSLQRDFHTLRGGAGFFGLTEIATTAGKIEDLLDRQGSGLTSSLEEIRSLIRDIHSRAEALPQPCEE